MQKGYWFARTTLETDKCIVQAGIRQERCNPTWGRISDHRPFGLKRVDADFIFGVHADQFVGAKLEEFRRRLPWERKDDQHPPLSENIYLTTPILSITRAYREKRLDGIVCECANSGIYTASSKLCYRRQLSVKRSHQWCLGLPIITYIIKDEQVRGQSFGQILLNTGLLASQELSHDRLQTCGHERGSSKDDQVGLGLEEGRVMKDVTAERRDTAAADRSVPRPL